MMPEGLNEKLYILPLAGVELCIANNIGMALKIDPHVLCSSSAAGSVT